MPKSILANLSISQKLLFSIAIVLFGSMAIGGHLLNGVVSKQMTSSYLGAVNTLAISLSDGVKGSLERGQMKRFKEMLQRQTKIKGVVDVSLYDPQGKIYLSSSDAGSISKIIPPKIAGVLEQTLEQQQVIEGEVIKIYLPQTVNGDCIRCHPTWNKDGIGGVLTLTYSLEELTQNISKMRYMLIVGVFVLLVVICVIIILIARQITRPLTEMTVAMGELASNKFETEIPAKDRSDEIGKMAEAVEIFKTNGIEKRRLHQLMQDMANTFESSIGEVISSVVESVTDLQNSAKTLSEAADNTHQQSSSAAASSEQTSAMVASVSEATERLIVTANEISVQTNNSTKVINQASEKADSTSEMVNSLASASQQIEEVTGLITTIAGQTDLLALNAAIEAARAGDAGKGFAVVANEVKELSKKTTTATTKIGTQIGDIQSASSEVVDAINVFCEIIDQLNTISDTISSVVEQQSGVTSEINKFTEMAASGTKEVVDNITVVIEAADNTGQAANQVLNNAGKLSKQAEVLKKEVRSFLEQVRATA